MGFFCSVHLTNMCTNYKLMPDGCLLCLNRHNFFPPLHPPCYHGNKSTATAPAVWSHWKNLSHSSPFLSHFSSLCLQLQRQDSPKDDVYSVSSPLMSYSFIIRFSISRQNTARPSRKKDTDCSRNGQWVEACPINHWTLAIGETP